MSAPAMDQLKVEVELRQAALDAAAERLARSKLHMSRIGAAAHTKREYATPEVYEAALVEVAEAKRAHQLCQRELGVATRAVKDAEYKSSRQPGGKDDPDRKRVFHEHFTRIAKTLLPRETFDIIAEAAQRAVEMNEDDKARELTGRALPALGSSGGMRVRQ